jgi:hypothetical protein
MPFKDAKQCSANSKRSGELCRNPAMPNGKCRMHGGKAPTGFAAANFKHGRHSKYLKHLSESKQLRFNDLDDQPTPPSVREETDLIVLQIQQMLETLSDTTVFENWSQIRKNCKSLRKAVRNAFKDQESKPSPEVKAILDHLDELFAIGTGNWKTWEQINKKIEQIRKLKETESKLLTRNLKEEQIRMKVVPVEIFHKFVMEVGTQFELSPGEIRKQQMHGLAAAFNALPPVIRES